MNAQPDPLDSLLSHYPDPAVPAGFAERVVAAARGAAPPGRRFGGRGLVRLIGLAAAAAVVAGASVLFFARRDEPSLTTPASVAALDAVPAAALEDDVLLDLFVGLDDGAFEAFLAGDYDDLATEGAG